MYELPETWRQLLKAVAEAPLAWQGPDDLAEGLGWGLEVTLDRLADLDVAGWLEVWDLDEGPTVTLSPLAAERLGLRLVEQGRDESPRWWPSGDPEPPRPKARNVCITERGAVLDFIVDPGPGPLDLILRVDTPEAGRPSNAEAARGIARPRLMIGTGQTPWPGPDAAREPACPVCHGLPLADNAYCLYCDRWGLDHRIEPEAAGAPIDLPRAAWRQPSIAAARRAEARLKAGHQRRRDKRLARLANRGKQTAGRPNAGWHADPPGGRVKASAPRSPKSALCSRPS